MSGGSWDYFTYKMDDVANRLKEDKEPLRRAFGEHMRLCAEAVRAVEWVDSGDWGDGDEMEYIRKALGDSAAEKEVSELQKELLTIRNKLNEILG